MKNKDGLNGARAYVGRRRIPFPSHMTNMGVQPKFKMSKDVRKTHLERGRIVAGNAAHGKNPRAL
jgi:hypothetical protein